MVQDVEDVLCEYWLRACSAVPCIGQLWRRLDWLQATTLSHCPCDLGRSRLTCASLDSTRLWCPLSPFPQGPPAGRKMSTGEHAGETCPTQFDFGIRLGLVLIMETACLSALSVTGLLVYIGVSVSSLGGTTSEPLLRASFQYSAATIRRNAVKKWTVTTHVHWYFLSLLVSEMIQAIGQSASYQHHISASPNSSALIRRHHKCEVGCRSGTP